MLFIPFVGVNVNGCDSDGNTALHAAAANNRAACVGALLRAGASANSTNSEGWTPLMQAVRHAHDAAMTALLHAGADATCKTVLGK